MSEKAPQSSRFQDALDNFDSNMAEEWENRLQGEAGKTDFSGDAKKRLEEAEAYYRHMEGLDGRDRGEEIYNEHEAAFSNEWEDAIADDEAFNAAREAALEEKFAKNPSLRRMRNISQEIADIRATEVTADNDKDLKERLAKREDALNELLIAYEASDDYDEAIANMFMDPSDANRNIVANQALREQNKAADKSDKAEKAKVDENDPASQALDLISAWNDPELRKGIKQDPEKLKAVMEELDKLKKELDDAAKAAEETNKKSKTLRNWGGGISALRDPKETREDEAAHNFVEDREEAHEQALPINAEFDAYVAEKEAEADKTRIHDPKEAEKEAYAELTRVKDHDQAWDEALKQKDIQNDPNFAYFDVNGNPVYFNAKAAKRYEKMSSAEKRGRLKSKALKVLGAVALVGGAIFAGNLLAGDKDAHVDNNVDSGTNAPAAPNATETKPPVTVKPVEKVDSHAEILKSEAWNIPAGSGGEALMNRLHVDKGVWYENEAEFQKKFPGEAYWMQDGHVGLKDPGALPMSAREFWATKIDNQQK